MQPAPREPCFRTSARPYRPSESRVAVPGDPVQLERTQPPAAHQKLVLVQALNSWREYWRPMPCALALGSHGRRQPAHPGRRTAQSRRHRVVPGPSLLSFAAFAPPPKWSRSFNVPAGFTAGRLEVPGISCARSRVSAIAEQYVMPSGVGPTRPASASDAEQDGRRTARTCSNMCRDAGLRLLENPAFRVCPAQAAAARASVAGQGVIPGA